LKRIVIFLACLVNRNLRYGKSGNRLLQLFVIRLRFLLKQYISRHSGAVNKIGTVKINLKHAGKMELQTNEYIDHWLYTGADFEPHVVRLFLKYLSRGNNVMDVGANIGYFTLIASHLIRDEGIVYAFEPSPANNQKLRRNIELNKIHNVIVSANAVSDTTGIATFSIPSGEIKNSGRSSFRTLEEDCLQLEVKTISIDAELRNYKKIDLIKMDIEGAEARALAGMAELIKRDQPVIIMELSNSYLQQLGSSADAVIHFFLSLEYVIYLAGEEIIQLKSNSQLQNDQYDILCLPMGKEYIE
jgi:FkbM family methyltransferase